MLDAGQNIITRLLPKTGQVISYRAGDDGDIEAGWWRGRLNANNRQRFIVKSVAGGYVVVDRVTGLMWPEDWAGGGANFGGLLNWDNAIDWCLACATLGFDDWRLPNILELLSIIKVSAGAAPFVQTPFINCRIEPYHYWTSTTAAYLTTSAYALRFSYPTIGTYAKTDTKNLVAVRECAL